MKKLKNYINNLKKERENNISYFNEDLMFDRLLLNIAGLILGFIFMIKVSIIPESLNLTDRVLGLASLVYILVSLSVIIKIIKRFRLEKYKFDLGFIKDYMIIFWVISLHIFSFLYLNFELGLYLLSNTINENLVKEVFSIAEAFVKLIQVLLWVFIIIVNCKLVLFFSLLKDNKNDTKKNRKNRIKE